MFNKDVALNATKQGEFITIHDGLNGPHKVYDPNGHCGFDANNRLIGQIAHENAGIVKVSYGPDLEYVNVFSAKDVYEVKMTEVNPTTLKSVLSLLDGMKYHSFRFFHDGSGYILNTSGGEIDKFDNESDLFEKANKLIDLENRKNNLISAIQACKMDRKSIMEILDSNGIF